MSEIFNRRSAEFENDYEAAKLYGAWIDYIATRETSKVVASENRPPKSIVAEMLGDIEEWQGTTYHRIIEHEDPLDANNVTYEVRYAIQSPRGASLADMYQTIPQVEAQLDEFLEQLGGRNITGRTLT